MKRFQLSIEAQDALIADYVGGASLEQLGPKYGCSAESIRNTLVRRGVPRRRPGLRPSPLSPIKVCSSCGDERPREEFYGNGKKTSECPRCISEKFKERYRSDETFRLKQIESAKQWQDSHPQEARAKKRRWYSGWTQEQFDAAWEVQGGRCSICQALMRREGTNADSVCADHDHETGQRRDLLCRRCNAHLGIYEKHKNVFGVYIEKHRSLS